MSRPGALAERIHGSAFGIDRSRLKFSNFGKSMDTQGWGEAVANGSGNNSLTPAAEEDRVLAFSNLVNLKRFGYK